MGADGKEIKLKSPFGDELPEKGFDAGVHRLCLFDVCGCHSWYCGCKPFAHEHECHVASDIFDQVLWS